jgi:hypothetical protein
MIEVLAVFLGTLLVGYLLGSGLRKADRRPS